MGKVKKFRVTVVVELTSELMGTSQDDAVKRGELSITNKLESVGEFGFCDGWESVVMDEHGYAWEVAENG